MNDALGVLQRIRTPRARPQVLETERCELCAETIAEGHGHLVDVHARTLLCACRGCYLLFTSEGAGGTHFRAVPDRYVGFTDFSLSRTQWEDLQIPVSVAFFFLNSSLQRVAAFYPGPAGATESLLPLETWAEIVAAAPLLGTLQPDVEALLVRQGGPARSGDGTDGEAECFIVPIDACYELVGQLRRLWKGFDGGREAKDALEAFFDRIRSRAG